MITQITLQLHGIVCVASRSIDGDHVSISINNQVVWRPSNIRLHWNERSLVDFDKGIIRRNKCIEKLPQSMPQQFKWNCGSHPMVIQLDVLGLFNKHHTVGHIVLHPPVATSRRIQQRIVGAGADYCLAYSLTISDLSSILATVNTASNQGA